ncbi:hypothetical protein KRP22_003959 [Phytophthora ramorum]|nr:hypothetical protein KRP22_9892 [Phytophthora ramorum]
MLVLRVRCVDDGREMLLERHGADAHHVQVAELKFLILQQRRSFSRPGDVTIQSDPQPSDLEECFVLLGGQILADPDVVDLNALRSSDFFVFAPDVPQSAVSSSSSNEIQRSDADPAMLQVLRSQLVDMGFLKKLATQALRQSGNNLSDAVALLAEGKVDGLPSDNESMDSEEKESGLAMPHPSIAPLGSLVHDTNVLKLRELAARDSFQALLLLREQFSSDVLNQLNENPVATLRLLSLPAPEVEGVIDVDSDNYPVETSRDSDTAIDRLVSLGFARDLVKIMYESCGGDEQRTANALLQTLES